MPPKSQDTFPKNYEDARAQFLAQAQAIADRHPGAETRSFNVPSAKDPNLYVDELFVPSIASPVSLLVLTSGVHGLEAGLGSAVQLQFMREFLPQAAAKGVAVWIVHCLNPYGYKFGRRTTEENINLNRNFGTNFTVPNPGYLKLAPHFERKKKASGFLHPLKTLSFLTKLLVSGDFNERTLSQAISQGQFTNPQGLEYGGTKPTPQAHYFRERFEEIEKPFEEIVLLDLHTGLGHRNRLHLLTGINVEQCVHKPTFERLFQPEKEVALYEFNSGDEKGFYQTIGDINTMVAEAAPLKKVVALTLEFGTLGNNVFAKADSLSRLWLENQGHFNGYASQSERQKIRQRFKELFNPQERAWQLNALSITRKVLGNTLERI